MLTSYCASNSTAGTSTGAADRNARVTAIVALVTLLYISFGVE